MLAAQSRQKSCADKKRGPVEFQEGNKIFLIVAPMKGILWFGKKAKLSPHYIRPFEILERIDKVPYRLDLPLELLMVRDVFHVPMIKKYVPDSTHVLT